MPSGEPRKLTSVLPCFRSELRDSRVPIQGERRVYCDCFPSGLDETNTLIFIYLKASNLELLMPKFRLQFPDPRQRNRFLDTFCYSC